MRPKAQRRLWLQLLEGSFDLICADPSDEVELTDLKREMKEAANCGGLMLVRNQLS
jgi:hypothetical protein